MTTIAAVVPVFNRAALIERCLDSIFEQTRPPDEVIVVDDGSSDGSGDVADAYRARTGRRLLVVRQPNAGAGAARSHGLRRATAPWVAFLDSDDTWTPDHLARIEAAIMATGGGAVLYFQDTTRGPSEGAGSHCAAASFAIPEPHVAVADASAWVLQKLQPMMLQASVVDRQVALEIGGFRSTTFPRDDTDFFFRLGLGRPMCAVRGTGTIMTDDGGSVRVGERTNRKSDRYWLATIEMYRALLDHPALDADGRRTAVRRLSVAHLRLAASQTRQRSLGQAIGHMGRALRTSPRAVGQTVLAAVPGRRAEPNLARPVGRG